MKLTRFLLYVVYSWDFDNCQTPAYFMQVLAAQMGGILSELEWVLLDMAPRYENAKLALAKSAAGGIKEPHYTESYYLLANNITSGGFN